MRTLGRLTAAATTVVVAVLLLGGDASAAASRHFYIPSSPGKGSSSADVTINGGQVCVRLYNEGASGHATARAYNGTALLLNLTDYSPGSGYVCGNAMGITKVTGGLWLDDGRAAWADFMSNTSAGTYHKYGF